MNPYGRLWIRLRSTRLEPVPVTLPQALARNIILGISEPALEVEAIRAAEVLERLAQGFCDQLGREGFELIPQDTEAAHKGADYRFLIRGGESRMTLLIRIRERHARGRIPLEFHLLGGPGDGSIVSKLLNHLEVLVKEFLDVSHVYIEEQTVRLRASQAISSQEDQDLALIPWLASVGMTMPGEGVGVSEVSVDGGGFLADPVSTDVGGGWFDGSGLDEGGGWL